MAPKIKFNELISIEDWSGALQRILDAAAEATRNEDSEARQGLMDLLLTFIKRSPAKIEVLDVIAREAIEDLSLAEISISLERLASRSAELSRAVGLIDAVAAEARKDARTLQLESTLDALRKAKVAVDALRKVEKALDQPDAGLLEALKSSSEAIGVAAEAMRA